MKKLVILISLLTFFSCSFQTIISVKANSVGSYLRVIDNSTPFFSYATDTEPLFFLPYTYYVKVIEQEGNLLHVEFGGENSNQAIDGFVPTSLLFDDNLSASSRYPNQKITTAKNTVLYGDKNLSSLHQYIFTGRELVFYGTALAPDGSTLYFVSYYDKFGFIKEADVVPFSLPLHPNPLTFIPEPEEQPPESSTPSQETNSSTDGLRIVIIGSVCFAGVIALFLTIKPKRQKIQSQYFEEGEYE